MTLTLKVHHPESSQWHDHREEQWFLFYKILLLGHDTEQDSRSRFGEIQ